MGTSPTPQDADNNNLLAHDKPITNLKKITEGENLSDIDDDCNPTMFGKAA